MSNENNYEYTEIVSSMLESCDDLMNLDEIISNLYEQKSRWEKKSKEVFDDLLKGQLLKKAKYSKTSLAAVIGCSRPTLDSWLKGIIPSRENMIRIGLVAGYDLNQINELLTKYGFYQELYPKILSDCVCLFVINTYNEKRCEQYRRILGELEKSITDNSPEEVEIDTEYFGAMVSDIEAEVELVKFISENIGTFKNTYHRLYAYVHALFYGAEDSEKSGLFGIDGMYANSPIYGIADEQKWSASLKRAVSEIQNRKWIPTREKIISLGIHLNMYRVDIDEMLRRAHMKELYAKNVFEALIIFITESADLEGLYDPDEDGEVSQYALLNYAYDILNKYRKYPEIERFFNEITRVDEEE
ncbi:helix-turn-helix domain-containing protein [Butyrivibrio sp. YAB3001]|uniref:helix-turn-helix domain-containing protein n=1 Tax=Butyrivibrio sp. YAB3001 TaxID=1520812 RepID=UPI000B81A4BA|nr:helix-turn-helix domain-containing protein [Butyrivibrio sp. YAB3001]